MKTTPHVLLSVLVAVAVLTAMVAGCAPSVNESATPAERVVGTKSETVPTAVYLAPASGAVFTTADLNSHESVAVVHDQRALASQVTTRIAIWVDKGSLDVVDPKWLHRRAEFERCPVALVGYNSAVYSFRDRLSISGMHGGPVDWSKVRLEPGFSVWMLKKGSTRNARSGYLRGFDATPTVTRVLSVTDPLLRDEIPAK